jgi:hypothetical protein
MTSIVLGDSTLESLIPSVNVPWKGLSMAVSVASSFCCTKEQAEPGQSGLSGPGLAPGLARQEPGFALPCPALPYSQYLAQSSIFVRIPCLSSSAFHVNFPCPHNGHLGIHSSWNRHSVHCVKHSKVFHFVFECSTSLQGRQICLVS